MATKNNEKRALNNALKEEYKSLTMLNKVLNAKKESSEMKEFLNAYSLTFEQITNFDYYKAGLKLSTFVNAKGEPYETISRVNKDGETVRAKWSFWLILTAAIKVRKEELKKAGLKAMQAKEKSIEDLKQAETKKAETKKAETKKAETKKAETKKAETKQAETKQAETKQAETKQAETKQAETK